MITNLATVSLNLSHFTLKKDEVVIRTKPEIAKRINKLLAELMEN